MVFSKYSMIRTHRRKHINFGVTVKKLRNIEYRQQIGNFTSRDILCCFVSHMGPTPHSCPILYPFLPETLVFFSLSLSLSLFLYSPSLLLPYHITTQLSLHSSLSALSLKLWTLSPSRQPQTPIHLAALVSPITPIVPHYHLPHSIPRIDEFTNLDNGRGRCTFLPR